jgi:hypothetical protein
MFKKADAASPELETEPRPSDYEPDARCRPGRLLAFEAGCEDYCEREVDEVE